jgi:hypothetical protein
MAAISGYKHTLMGLMHCPSRYPLMGFDETARNIPLYRLEEDAAAEPDFAGKAGDYLLGGGGDECACLRISMPEAVVFFTGELEDGVDFRPYTYFKAYWTWNDAFVFGDGFVKLGWNPTRHVMETWAAEHVVAFAIKHDQAVAAKQGKTILSMDGGIIRRPTPEDRALWVE